MAPPDPSPDRATSLPPRVVLGGVLVLVAVVYLPTLWFGFVYDDHWTLLANGFLRSPGDLPLLLGRSAHAAAVPDAFRPAAVAFDVLSYQLLGAHAFWHHLLSIALHVATAGLLGAWLRARELPLTTVAIVVAIFGTLAIHAEVVAVVSYREDALAALLALAAMIQADRGAQARGRARAWSLVAAAVLALLACHSKLSAAPLPALWCVSVWSWPRPWPSRPRVLAPALALTVGCVAALAHQRYILGELSPYAAQLGIHAAAWSRSEVLASSVQIHLGYLQQMLLPLGLSPEYVDRPGSWTAPATVLGAAGLTLALGHAAVSFARGRHRTWSLVAFATVLAWVPTSNLVALPNMRADRFAYLPSVFVCLGLGTLAWMLGRALARRLGHDAIAYAPAVALVVMQGAFAQAAATAYKSDARLWEVALRRAPDSARAHALLGELTIATMRATEGDEDPVLLARARAHCRRALALAPEDALPHLCAARLAVQLEQWTLAQRHFEAALARARAREDRILTALASVTLDVAELPYAERVARVDALLARAEREFPYASEVAAASGRLMHRLGRADAAFHRYARARRLRPERWDVALWGLELALDLGDAPAAQTLWARGKDLWSDADPKLVDATRRRVYDGGRLFSAGTPKWPGEHALPLIDLLPERPRDDP